MRLRSVQTNSQRLRFRQHAERDTTLKRRQSTTETVTLTTDADDGRTYHIELTRADTAQIIRHACESWTIHPAGLAFHLAPNLLTPNRRYYRNQAHTLY